MRADRRRGVTEIGSPRGRGGRPLQRDVLRDVMRSADECDTWLTLEELARITLFPPASISAQLRQFRKPRHGGFRLLKRCRAFAKPRLAGVVAGFPLAGPLWEYRLQLRTRRVMLSGRIVARKKIRAGGRGHKTRSRGGALWA